MISLLVAVVVIVVVVVVALVLRRRQRTDAPTQARWQVPTQLDRRDFLRPDAPWLVAVFTSSTCHVCADVARKAEVLECADVAVHEVEFSEARDLHRRYQIEAVPTLVVADDAGVVRASFLGPVTATDLWCAVAELREPGSTAQGEGCQRPE